MSLKTICSCAVILGFLFSVPLASASASEDHSHSNITVENAWFRATPPAADVTAGYAALTNSSAHDDRLIAISVDFAQKAEIHEMVQENEIMKMRPLAQGLVLPAGETVQLAPGGLHFMFMGLNRPLNDGEAVDLILQFEQSPDINMTVMVKKDGSSMSHSHNHADQSGHKH